MIENQRESIENQQRMNRESIKKSIYNQLRNQQRIIRESIGKSIENQQRINKELIEEEKTIRELLEIQ